MNIEKQLQKDGIIVTEKVSTEIVLNITNNIAQKISSTFPNFNLDPNDIFAKLFSLNMYKATMPEGMQEASYCYKNSSIYFNANISNEDLEEFAIHECIIVHGISFIRKCHALQAGAAVEQIFLNNRYFTWERNALQTFAVVENPFSKGSKAIRKVHALQIFAAVKRLCANGFDAFFHGDALQIIAGGKSLLTNGGNTARNGHALQAIEIIKCEIGKFCNGTIQHQMLYFRSVFIQQVHIFCIICRVVRSTAKGHLAPVVWGFDIQIRQATATIECAVKGGDTAADGHALQVGATAERITVKGGNTIRNGHAQKAGTTAERIVVNGSNTFTQCQTFHAGAFGKRTITNGGDTVGNRHAL